MALIVARHMVESGACTSTMFNGPCAAFVLSMLLHALPSITYIVGYNGECLVGSGRK